MRCNMEGQREAARIRQEVDAALREVDVIATPTGSTLGDKCDATTAMIRGRGGAGSVKGSLHKRNRQPHGDACHFGAVRLCLGG